MTSSGNAQDDARGAGGGALLQPSTAWSEIIEKAEADLSRVQSKRAVSRQRSQAAAKRTHLQGKKDFHRGFG